VANLVDLFLALLPATVLIQVHIIKNSLTTDASVFLHLLVFLRCGYLYINFKKHLFVSFSYVYLSKTSIVPGQALFIDLR